MKDKNLPHIAVPDLQVDHYTYDLPNDRIALRPLENRDDSKLLVASSHPLLMYDSRFQELPEILPPGSLLVLNDSKVLQARILCQKQTGGGAEVLLLEPIRPTPNPAIALERGSPSIWKSLIGGKRIRAGDTLVTETCLQICVLEKSGAEAQVELRWSPENQSLAEQLEHLGSIPLPPYLKRELEPLDQERYQTVYAKHLGSVAAPTAGLHFTDALRERLQRSGVGEERITLHVGAGTFKPVDSDRVVGHEMHAERFEVSLTALKRFVTALEPGPRRAPLVAVGTTSLRTLESLYWLGVRAIRNPRDELRFVEQWEAYAEPQGPDILPAQSIQALIGWLESRGLNRLTAQSQIMIVPGYPFKMADWLITNFHQPRSSLILLIAAWMGENWRSIYEHALQNSYRFLSYGDSSLLMRTLKKSVSE